MKDGGIVCENGESQKELLLDTKECRDVFWAGFRSSRSESGVIRSVACRRPLILHNHEVPLRSTVCEGSRLRMVMAFKIIRLNASDFSGSRPARSRGEIYVVRRRGVGTSHEPSAEIHRVRASSDCWVVRAVGRIPSGRARRSVKRHDSPRRHRILQHLIPFRDGQLFVRGGRKGQIGRISGGKPDERTEEGDCRKERFSEGRESGFGSFHGSFEEESGGMDMEWELRLPHPENRDPAPSSVVQAGNGASATAELEF